MLNRLVRLRAQSRSRSSAHDQPHDYELRRGVVSPTPSSPASGSDLQSTSMTFERLRMGSAGLGSELEDEGIEGPYLRSPSSSAGGSRDGSSESSISGASSGRGSMSLGSTRSSASSDMDSSRSALQRALPYQASIHRVSAAALQSGALPYRIIPRERDPLCIPKVTITRQPLGHADGDKKGLKAGGSFEVTGDLWITSKRVLVVTPSVDHRFFNDFVEFLQLAAVDLVNVSNESISWTGKKGDRLAMRFEVSAASPCSGVYTVEQRKRSRERSEEMARGFARLMHSVHVHRFTPFYVRSAAGDAVFIRQAFVNPSTYGIEYHDRPFEGRRLAYHDPETGELHLAAEMPPPEAEASSKGLPGGATVAGGVPAVAPGLVAYLSPNEQTRFENNVRRLEEVLGCSVAAFARC